MKKKQGAVPTKPLFEKTNFFVYLIIVLGALLLRVAFRLKILNRKALKEVRALKDPVLVIGNHVSSIDFLFMSYLLFPKRLSFVVARHLYYNDSSSWALRIMKNSIPKRQFVADYECVKSIKKMIDKGISVGLYPEGRVSIDGTESGLEPNIAKLIKWLGVPVVYVHFKGGYLAMPRYNLILKPVKAEAEAKVLFTKEEVDSLSVDEMHRRLKEEIRYNEFEYQEKNHISSGRKNTALGLNTLLYKCPRCHAEFKMEAEGDTICCGECGNAARLDKYGKISALPGGVCFPRIDLWYKFQKEAVAKEIEATDDYKLVCDDVGLAMNDDASGNFYAAERGKLTLSKEGFTYEGEGGKSLFFPIAASPSISFILGTAIDFFRGEDIFRFCFDREMMSTKFNIATELLHNKYYKQRQAAI
jgi:1-acyl-sn-glycerol-3-phosphate acyltransferase